MTTNKPEVFEVYRTRQGALENVVLLADYEALQAECDTLVEALEAALMVMTSKEVRLEKKADAITMARAALAAHHIKDNGNE